MCCLSFCSKLVNGATLTGRKVTQIPFICTKDCPSCKEDLVDTFFFAWVCARNVCFRNSLSFLRIDFRISSNQQVLYLSKCVCICIYIYTYIDMYICVLKYIYIYICMYIYIYTYVYIYIYIYV